MQSSILYIHHSCFAWEGPEALVVYDYWRDNYDGRLEKLLQSTEKQIYFVTSHFHEDHYNSAIFEIRRETEKPPILLISHDTFKRRRVPKEMEMTVLRPGDRYEDDLIELYAFRSTDVGVCTVITMKSADPEEEGHTAFHAGDNNNWYFPQGDDRIHILTHEMEGLFLSTLRDIQLKFPHITHAMFPLDSRLGCESLRGPSQWLARIDTEHFYPMHTWGRHAKALEEIDQLVYLFPHTQFHYEADEHGEETYGDFLQRVRNELDNPPTERVIIEEPESLSPDGDPMPEDNE